VGENIPRVDIDTAKLKWALNALLANTIRSTEPGGEIDVHLASRRKNVVLIVRSAHSLSPGSSTDFFSAFSRRGRHQASALTFSTARLIIEGHGGKIRVEPKGTPPAYTLTLPKSEAQKPEARHLTAASSGA
jgi:signal transduction histidine kinase